jgi:hypothetical protein
MDQDNRLWKMISNDEGYKALNSLISTLACQVVLCASANNEGWERRTWPVRVYHGIDRVPEDVVVEDLKATPAEVAFLDHYFGLYPLETVAAMKTLDALPRSDPKVRMARLYECAKVRYQDIAASFVDFYETLEGHKLMNAVLAPLYVEQEWSKNFDRRFLTVDSFRRLHAIHNVAYSALRKEAMELVEVYVTLLRSNWHATHAAGPRYELIFCQCAGLLLMSNGRESCLTRPSCKFDVPTKQDVAAICQMDNRHMVLALPCFQAQNVDFYLFSIDAASRKLNCSVLQLTTNDRHSPSHRDFANQGRIFTENRTMLEQLRDSGVNGSITFVYVTSNPTFTPDMRASLVMVTAQSSDLPVFEMMLRNYKNCKLYLLSINPRASHELQSSTVQLACYVVLLPLDVLLVVAAQLQLDTAESLFLPRSVTPSRGR